MFKVGLGYDVHQLVADRPLILGGITVPYDKGLLGHSDADVLTHTLMDAMLGALALGNIGDHFPDTDPKYKDASSMNLLTAVQRMVTEKGYAIGNIDSVVVAQAPKLRPYIPEIRQNLATAVQANIGAVSVKATTSEWLGFEGRGEGISAQAVVLLMPLE